MAEPEHNDKHLVVTLNTADGGLPTVVVSGEIDLSTADQVATAIRQVLDEAPTTVGFDLRGVTFMDSSGLALLITAAQQAEVLVHNPTPQVRRIIELTGLTSVLGLA